MTTRAYEYHHVIGFEETNLVGNVYYVNHIRWQGRCREMFLQEHAPDVLDELSRDLRLVTLRCSCEYLAELNAFDKIIVRMRLGEMNQNRLTLLFEYFRSQEGGEDIVGRGEQEIACMEHIKGKLTPTHVPESLRRALKTYVE
jgi:enediyne biosynthesis thioesterase